MVAEVGAHAGSQGAQGLALAERDCAAVGGIDLELTLPELMAQTDANLAKGFKAVKMKVGRDRLHEFRDDFPEFDGVGREIAAALVEGAAFPSFSFDRFKSGSDGEEAAGAALLD